MGLPRPRLVLGSALALGSAAALPTNADGVVHNSHPLVHEAAFKELGSGVLQPASGEDGVGYSTGSGEISSGSGEMLWQGSLPTAVNVSLPGGTNITLPIGTAVDVPDSVPALPATNASDAVATPQPFAETLDGTTQPFAAIINDTMQTNGTTAVAPAVPPSPAVPAPSPAPPAMPPPPPPVRQIEIEARLSVATDTAETLTAGDFCTRVKAAAEALPGLINPNATVYINKEERVAVALPQGVTEIMMTSALTTTQCEGEVSPVCVVIPAAPTSGQVRLAQTARTFMIERNLYITDTRTLAPPIVDSNALATALNTLGAPGGALSPSTSPLPPPFVDPPGTPRLLRCPCTPTLLYPLLPASPLSPLLTRPASPILHAQSPGVTCRVRATARRSRSTFLSAPTRTPSALVRRPPLRPPRVCPTSLPPTWE